MHPRAWLPRACSTPDSKGWTISVRACAWGAVAAATAAALLITGCGSQPKTAAGFCQVYDQQKSQYLAKYGKPASGGGLADFAQLIGALSDWVTIFQALDQAAPPDIEPDVHNIVTSLQQEEQDVGQEASNPFGGLAAGMMAGLMSTSSWDNVGAYVTRNCGPQDQ